MSPNPFPKPDHVKRRLDQLEEEIATLEIEVELGARNALIPNSKVADTKSKLEERRSWRNAIEKEWAL